MNMEIKNINGQMPQGMPSYIYLEDGTKITREEFLESKSHILHLKCSKCENTDIVFSHKAKQWKCPFCDCKLICSPSSTDEFHKKLSDMCINEPCIDIFHIYSSEKRKSSQNEVRNEKC